MERAIERLFPDAEDQAAAMRIVQVLFEKPDDVLRAEEILRRADVSLMQGLVVLARLTSQGLIQHPRPGAYSVGRIARSQAS